MAPPTRIRKPSNYDMLKDIKNRLKKNEDLLTILPDLPSDALWALFHLSHCGKMPDEATCKDCRDYEFCDRSHNPAYCADHSDMQMIPEKLARTKEIR